MAAQQHKIMRQVLEVSGCPPGTGPQMQSALRGAYYQQLVPLIEKICSELSTPGHIQRLARLEIDLGDVSLDALGATIAERFEDTFRRKLAAAIGGPVGTASQLELFSYFIRTGFVPWWCDLSDRDLLETTLNELIRHAPQALLRELRDSPHQEPTMRRIAMAYSDRSLDGVVSIMAPSIATAWPGFGAQWIAMLDTASGTRGYSRSAARKIWWDEVFRVSSHDGASLAVAPALAGGILARLARRLGVDYGGLVAELNATVERGTLSVQPWARDVTRILWRELPGGTSIAPTPSIRVDSPGSVQRRAPGESVRSTETSASTGSLRTELLQLFARLGTTVVPDSGFVTQLRALLDCFPTALKAEAVARFDAAQAGEVPSSATLGALVRDALEQLGPPASTGLRSPATPVRTPEPPIDLTFSDTDAIYVANSGLVILWPFLATFFANLGLVEEKRFRDAAAVQRGVGLLQYLATGEAPTQEYLLPLNKVLCGMPLEEVFDFGPPLVDEEIEACADLLTAVIHQAPILREMSIPGFRSSFLLRAGQLSTPGGSWLLRVERETHDIVRDRFPWSVHVVKLPWMEAMMQVDW